MAFGESILQRLADKQIILPILENQIRADEWPDSFQVTIDTAPYYGLDEEGNPDGWFHPSSHSLRTPRQLYYEFHPDHKHLIEREPWGVQSLMTVAVGTSLHGIIQTQMQMAGLCSTEDIEPGYENVAHHVRGRGDMVARHPTEGPVCIEIKSRTSYKFDQTTIQDMPSWEIQLLLAMDNLGKRYNTDFTYGVLLMVETGYPFRMRELRVPRNDTLLAETYAKFDYVRECIRINTPPELCCSYKSAEMKSCAARHACWLKDHPA